MSVHFSGHCTYQLHVLSAENHCRPVQTLSEAYCRVVSPKNNDSVPTLPNVLVQKRCQLLAPEERTQRSRRLAL